MNILEVLSLEDLCIHSLIKHFDVLLPTFDRKENHGVKILLQRKFSDILFQQVKGPLQKRHASFLINPYLRDLDMNRFSLKDFDAIIEMLKIQGEGIVSLHVMDEYSWFSSVSRATLLQLASSLPRSLKSLWLEADECSGDILEIVAKTCLNLQVLEVPYCSKITDEAMKTFFLKCEEIKNTSLRKLTLSYTSVKQSGIAWILNNYSYLRELQHEALSNFFSDTYSHYMNNNISHFTKYDLEALYLWPEHLEAAHVLCLNPTCLKVRYLKTQAEINACGIFTNLTTIVFHSFQRISLSPFLETRGFNLEKADIKGNITFSVESLIQFCPNIQYLSLKSPKFESSERLRLDAFKFSLKNLQILEIRDINLDADKQHIRTIFRHSPNIEMVKFSHADKFTDKLVESITFPSLKTLHLNFADIGVSIISQFIVAAPNLEHISIEMCRDISEQDCRNLKSLKNGLSIFYEAAIYVFDRGNLQL